MKTATLDEQFKTIQECINSKQSGTVFHYYVIANPDLIDKEVIESYLKGVKVLKVLKDPQDKDMVVFQLIKD